MTYRDRHITVSANLTTTEHDDVGRIATTQGQTRSAFAAQAIRDAIATAKEAQALIPSLVPTESV